MVNNLWKAHRLDQSAFVSFYLHSIFIFGEIDFLVKKTSPSTFHGDSRKLWANSCWQKKNKKNNNNNKRKCKERKEREEQERSDARKRKRKRMESSRGRRQIAEKDSLQQCFIGQLLLFYCNLIVFDGSSSSFFFFFCPLFFFSSSGKAMQGAHTRQRPIPRIEMKQQNKIKARWKEMKMPCL